MIEIDNNCTACGACTEVCPKHCISVIANNKGFLYPHINTEQCVNCHACEDICHTKKRIESHFESKVFAVKSNNETFLRRSTSGGAFSALAEYVLNRGGVVYGCAYVNHLKAKHIRVDNLEKLYQLNGSKYVQSDCSNSFEAVRRDLSSDKLVLFSGTPCQISSLRSYLKEDIQNLITVDIVCHGVSSQAFFDKYLEWYERNNNIEIDNYDFRSKQNSKWSLAGICSGVDRNTGRIITKKVFYYNEFYYFYFLKGLAYRESCYKCRYANMVRTGDITLGDMWGAETLDLNYDVRDGCSLFIVNNEKGLYLLDQIDVNATSIGIDQAIKLNEQLVKPSRIPEKYKEIIDFISNADAGEIDKDFRISFRKERLLGFLKYHVPSRLKRWIKKVGKS